MVKRQKIPKDSGLTLIEVIFAIILFAGAMITILGLQSSNLSRTLEDKNKIRAMLAAREILAAIEIQEETLEPGNRSGSVEDIIAGLINHPKDKENSPHQGLLAQLDIENVALPEIGPTALQKTTVTVSWGDLPFEQFKTSFFLSGELETNAIKDDQ
jgi:hypothetical protein